MKKTTHINIAKALMLFVAMIGYLGIGANNVNAEYCDPTQPETPDGMQRFYAYDYPYYFFNAITYVRIFPKGQENDQNTYTLDDELCYGPNWQNWERYDIRTDNGVDVPELTLGTTYTIKWTTAFTYYYQYYYYMLYYRNHDRVYIDINQDEFWDQDDENEYIFESYDYDDYCGSRYPYPYNCNHTYSYWGYWYLYYNTSTCNYQYRGFNYNNQPIPAWDEHEVDLVLDCELTQPGMTRLRITTEAWANTTDDPCYMGRFYNYGTYGYNYIYYGHTVDYDIEIVGTTLDPFPAQNGTMFASEEYDGSTRVPAAAGFNDAIKFSKPHVTFPNDPSNDAKMKYFIFGPLPDRTVVYRATSGPNEDDVLVDIGANMLGTAPGLSRNGNGELVWTAFSAGQYDDRDGLWVSNENGIPYTDGSFYAARAGEYVLGIEITDSEGNPDDCGGESFYSFTIRAENDMAATSIYRPRRNGDPDFTKYPQYSEVPITGTFKNLGLNDVKNFTVRYVITGHSGEAEGIETSGEYTYDWDNQEARKLEPGDEEEIQFGRYRLPAIGEYAIRMEVVDIDGDPDNDDEHFNNYFPRPAGVDNNDNWIHNPTYIFEAAYEIDLAGDMVLFPMEAEEVETREDQIIVNRPFRPEVQFKNYGINDAASDDADQITARFEIYNSNNEEVANGTTVIEDVPSGRYNIAKVTFPDVILQEEGEYRIFAEIDFDPEVPDALGNNTVEGTFEVLPGLQGEYTVGMMYSGEERNFETIRDAMDAMYFLGVSDDITFLLTDAEYNVGGTDAAWNMTSHIIGLGYNAETDNTVTMTWKAASNRAVMKSGVKINLASATGYGVRFGQALFNNDFTNAPVNYYNDVEYINSPGYITFDGGALKSLEFVMQSVTDFQAPFYLGKGSHHITLKNLVVSNDDPFSAQTEVHLPRKTIVDDRAQFDDDADITRDANDQIVSNYTYSAGVVNRANFFDVDALGDRDLQRSDIDLIPNNNNTIDGLEISGFGYGIVSFGYGAIFVPEEAEYIEFNNHSNKYTNNTIYNVGRAGIAIGNEDGSEISGNMIYDVNTDNPTSVDDRGDSYDHAGIMIGNLIYERADNGDKTEGYHAYNLTINGNRISNVHSDVFATGIKIEQDPNSFGTSDQDRFLVPSKEEQMMVTNNIVKSMDAANGAPKAGIHLFTTREDNDITVQDQAFPAYRTRDDKIYNNTIMLDANSDGSESGLVAGIGIQQTSGTEIYNNIIAITDENISATNDLASLLLVQGELPADGGPQSDNNAFWVSENSGAVTVRLIEMDPETHGVKFMNSRNDFVNLEQWRVWTGSDRSSVQENFLGDLDVTSNDIRVKMTNGKYPLGSVLNNRGRRIKDLTGDAFGEDRGVTGQRYDIGAQEFKGELFTSDLNMQRIEEPASYKSAVYDPNRTDYNFTDAEHIMTTAPVMVSTRVRNEGSLQQSGSELKLEIYRETSANELELVSTEMATVTVSSTNEEIVSFYSEGEGFEPMTYAELINGDIDDYTVPAAYSGMEANVTPRYKLVISTESDENNYNNESEKWVRFYLRKADLDIMVSGRYNNSDIVTANDEELGGTLNMSNLRTGMLGLGWRLRPDQGDYDYDLFDRSGWEPRAVNYDDYRTLVWVDGGTDQDDVLDQLEMDALESFLGSSEDEIKKNFIAASQGLVREASEEFSKKYLRAEYLGNPLGNGEAYFNTVTGINVAQDWEIEVKEPALSNGDTDLYPYPSVMSVYNEEGDGLAEAAFKYDSTIAQFEKNNTMGVATSTLAYNSVYFGIDWRHFDNIDIVLKGVLDYLNANDGSIVPVELTAFDANQVGNKVVLNWETSSEINSSKFVVEKSNVLDGNVTSFSAIAEVSAAGTSSETNFYGPVTDEEVTFGQTYAYRLKSVDLDGSYDYSGVKMVTLGGLEGTLSVETIAPNPTENGLTTMTLNLTEEMNVSIEIYDMSGSLVSTVQRTEMMTAGRYPIAIDMSSSANGVYNVVIKADEMQLVQQINVVK